MKESSLCAVGKPWLHTPCCTCTHLTLKGLWKHVCFGVINIVLIKWNWIHLCSFDYTFTVHIHTRLQRCYQLQLTALQLCLEQHTSYGIYRPGIKCSFYWILCMHRLAKSALSYNAMCSAWPSVPCVMNEAQVKSPMSLTSSILID